MLDSHVANISKNTITKNSFSENAKIASIRPNCKGKGCEELEIVFEKSMEIWKLKLFFKKFFLEKFKLFVNSFVNKKLHTERIVVPPCFNKINWILGKIARSQSRFSRSFTHALNIAKLYSYGFTQKTVLHLKYVKRKVKANSSLCKFLILLLGMPRGSILVPVLFNIYS